MTKKSTQIVRQMSIGLLMCAPLALAATPIKDTHSHHTSVGKRGAPLSLLTTAEHEAGVGDTVPVTLAFRLDHNVDQIHVVVFADDGLSFKNNAGKTQHEFTFSDVAAGRFELPTVDVSVDQAGRRSVNANITVTRRGEPRFSSFSVPVRTPGSKATVTKAKVLKTDASGRPVRVMPATQTSR